MKSFRKILTAILSFVMIMTMSVPSLAYDDVTDGVSGDRAKAGIAFLGTGNTPIVVDTKAQLDAANASLDTSTWVAGTTQFWVGLYYSDLSKMDRNIGELIAEDGLTEIKSHFVTTDGDMDSSGIYRVMSKIGYDPEYISPVSNSITANGMRTRLNATDIYKDKSGENVRSVTVSPNNVAYSEKSGQLPLSFSDEQKARLKMISTQLSITNLALLTSYDIDSDSAVPDEEVTDNPIFFSIVRFKYDKAVPAGTTVVEAILDSQCTIETGFAEDEQRWGGQWNVDRTITPSANLYNNCDYVGAPDFFPAAPEAVTAAVVKTNPTSFRDDNSDGKADSAIEYGQSMGLGSAVLTITTDAGNTKDISLKEAIDDWKATITFGGVTYSKAAGNSSALASVTATNAMNDADLTITFPSVAALTIGKFAVKDSVTSIAITTQPTKLSYTVNDTLDLSGLVITETHTSGAKTTLTGAQVAASADYTLTANGTNVDGTATKAALAMNGKPIVVTNTAVNKSANTSNLTVANAIKSISVKTQPTKLAYEYGDKLALSGLSIDVVYEDASDNKTVVYNDHKEDFSFKTLGGSNIADGATLDNITSYDGAITVTYGGKTAATSAIDVSPKQLTVSGTINLSDFTISSSMYTVDGNDKKANAEINYSPTTGSLASSLISGLLDADKNKVKINYTVTDPKLYDANDVIAEGTQTKALTLTLANAEGATGNPAANYTFGTGGTANGQLKVVVTEDPLNCLVADDTYLNSDGAYEIDLSDTATFGAVLSELAVKIVKESNKNDIDNIDPTTLAAMLALDPPATIKALDDGVNVDVSSDTKITPTMTALTVNYRGKEVTIPLVVKNPVVKVEVLDGTPDKALNSYTHGDDVDLTGLRIKLSYAYKPDGTNNETEVYAYDDLPAGASLEITLEGGDELPEKAVRSDMNGKKLEINYTDADSDITNNNAGTFTVAAADGEISADGAADGKIGVSTKNASETARPAFTLTAENGANDKTQAKFTVTLCDEDGTEIGAWPAGQSLGEAFPDADFGSYKLKVTYHDADGNFNDAAETVFDFEITKQKSGGGGSSSGSTTVVDITPVEEETDDRLIIPIPAIPDDTPMKPYMKGYREEDGSTVFRPGIGITRAEVATLIARLLPGYDESLSYDPESLEFGDIEGSAWYKNTVYFAVQKGLVNGYEDGSFRPDQTISRQEFAAIIARYLELANEGESEYSDNDGWGAGYIAQLSKAHIKVGDNEPDEDTVLNGYEDGTFRPNNNITRAEVTKVLNRVFGRKPNPDKIKENIGKYDVSLVDVPESFWAYYEILVAASDYTYGEFH